MPPGGAWGGSPGKTFYQTVKNMTKKVPYHHTANALRRLFATHRAKFQAVAMAAPASGLATEPAPIAFSWGAYIQAIVVMGLLLGLLWLGLWLLRRSGKFRFLPQPGKLPKDALVLEHQLPLGPRKAVMVVRFLNRSLVLGVTDQQITLLTEMGPDNESSRSFKQFLAEEGSQPQSPPGD